MATNRLYDSVGATTASTTVKTRKKRTQPTTTTEKGALTYATTGTKVLDLFSKVGSMRTRSEHILPLLTAAWNENIPLTGACIFWLRDILHGAGERGLFRTALQWMAVKHPTEAAKLIRFVPEYGRWDDLLSLKNTSVYNQALDFWGTQLLKDFAAINKDKNASITLAAKWAPSEKAGKKSRVFSRDLRKRMGLSARSYRILLVQLRKRLNLVESDFCAKQFSNVEYKKVPSRAMHIYGRKKMVKNGKPGAFLRNDGARFVEFLGEQKKKADKGEKLDIKAATMAPYDIVSRLVKLQKQVPANGVSYKSRLLQYQDTDPTSELQWTALPNYFKEAQNMVVVADTSGSMEHFVAESVKRIEVAISLALYAAERNPSEMWKGKFFTFGDVARLLDIKGDNLAKKITSIWNSEVGGTTNLQSVFDLILTRAKQYHLTQKDLPDTIVIVSDMQFDSATNPYGYRGSRSTNLEAITQKFQDAGYVRPNIIFWDVAAPKMEAPATYDERGVALYSGLSATIFSSVCKGAYNPVDAMLDVLDSPRYKQIIQALETR